MRVPSVLLAGLCLLGTALTAQPMPLNWLIDDQPPQFILDGPDKGQGSVDGILEYFQARLPEYKHSVTVANIQRSLALLQTDAMDAGIGYVKTPEREKILLFSKAFSVGFPAGILFRRSDLDSIRRYINPDGLLDLDALLAAGHIQVGVAAGRSYGANTDAILARHQGGVVMTRFATTGIMAGLVQMLAENRVDAIFAFRSEMRYVIRDEARLASLIVLPLLSAGNPITVHVVAPRTDWGRALIERLNPLIVQARADPAFRAVADRWTDDESKALIAKTIRTID